MGYSLEIQRFVNDKVTDVYYPIIKDDVVWETEWKGSASKLTFTVIKDKDVAFQEGDLVIFKSNDVGIFKGFVFEKSRDKEHHIQVTAYDQLRYFANKHSMNYEDKTASELLKMLLDDFNMSKGTIENTNHRIAARDEDNQTYFDIVLNALTETLLNTKEEYVLFDDFGKVSLINIRSKVYGLEITTDTAENFQYTSSIDKDTYTEVLVVKVDKDNKSKPVEWLRYPENTTDNQKKWGILREVLKAGKDDNLLNVAKTFLEAKNRKTRELDITGCLGDLNVRAGVSVHVNLYIGDIHLNRYCLCSRVVHRFNHGVHLMDLTLEDTFTDE